MIDYYELRKIVSKIIPRQTRLKLDKNIVDAVKEKGRKTGYHQFNIKNKEWVKQERLLNTETVNSFLEISIRAAACPMPLNLDVWDGLICPFKCIYCFANAFRASLYTAFFDNSKTMGYRHCNPDFYKTELDKLMGSRGQNPKELSDIKKALAMEIPIRFGIRFEDFLYAEGKKGISLELLQYLANVDYPVMINTKSDLVAREEYLRALADNKGKAAVHITMISSNEGILKKLEPGAPTFKKRIEAGKKLVDAGVRVVARIEPFLLFVNDNKDDVEDYISQLKDAGIKNITFDTYSYTAHNPGIRSAFVSEGYDFERLFLLGCDSQAIGSLLLGSFMDIFQKQGFSCSTFDMGNTPQNNQTVCCEVEDWFGDGYNYGCTVWASRYIQQQNGKPVNWFEFEKFVEGKGGFLTEKIKADVKQLWNCDGNNAYSHSWAKGMEAVGIDENGLIWKFVKQSDFRLDILNSII